MAKRKKNSSILSIIGIFIATVLVISNEINFTLSDIIPSFEEKVILDTTDNLEIYYLDVGQADSILIRNNEKNVLIDAGNNADGPKLVTYFKSLGISEFEYVIGSHAHEDHIGGMDDIIENFQINNFYMPDVVTTTKTFEEVLDALEEKNIAFDTPNIGDKFTTSDMHFEVLYLNSDEDDLNANSIILMLKFGERRFLFTGDAEESSEKEILHKDIKADVLKVGHHGSRTSSSYSFLDRVKPEYAIIQVGEENSYKHPHDETLKRFKKMNTTVYRTDLHGTILIKSDGQTINIETIDTNTNG